jgi:hypothetical protein
MQRPPKRAKKPNSARHYSNEYQPVASVNGVAREALWEGQSTFKPEDSPEMTTNGFSLPRFWNDTPHTGGGVKKLRQETSLEKP